MVVAGVAVCLNGFVRTTQDLDLLVEASPANIQRLLSCLAEFGEGFARELSAEDFAMEEGAVRVVEDFTGRHLHADASAHLCRFSGRGAAFEVNDVAVRAIRN